MKLYKVFNIKIGLYASRGYNYWTKKGATFNEIGHLKSSLLYIARHIDTDTDINWYTRMKMKHKDVFQFLPDEWIVIEISESGFKEVCRAKDFYNYKI